MSLREEIKSELQELSTHLTKYLTASLISGKEAQDLSPKHMDVYVNNILSKFEKRIDSSLKDVKNHIDEIGIYTIDSQFHQGYQKALEDVKEMLK